MCSYCIIYVFVLVRNGSYWHYFPIVAIRSGGRTNFHESVRTTTNLCEPPRLRHEYDTHTAEFPTILYGRFWKFVDIIHNSYWVLVGVLVIREGHDSFEMFKTFVAKSRLKCVRTALVLCSYWCLLVRTGILSLSYWFVAYASCVLHDAYCVRHGLYSVRTGCVGFVV